MSKAEKVFSVAKVAGVRLVLIAALILSSASVSLGGTFVAFGPENYTRDTGQPVAVTTSFTILNPDTNYTLLINNGG